MTSGHTILYIGLLTTVEPPQKSSANKC